MFKLRKEQYDHLAEASFESYVERLARILGGPGFAESRNRHFPRGDSVDLLRTEVLRWIHRAEELGFHCEGDVTPFVILSFSMVEVLQDEGLEAWAQTVLQSRDIPPEDRIQAVFEVIPVPRRHMIFPQD